MITQKKQKIRKITPKKKTKVKKTENKKTQDKPKSKNKIDIYLDNVGEVYVAQTKYIDPETKKTRRYLVTKQNHQNGNVTVSKLQSIKNFDENGKNADKHLVEINQNYPGLTKRTGVDFYKYNKNRITNKPLNIKDKKVFNELPEFKVSNRDLRKAQIHTGTKKINRH